jgi:hypothetical protein
MVSKKAERNILVKSSICLNMALIKIHNLISKAEIGLITEIQTINITYMTKNLNELIKNY